MKPDGADSDGRSRRRRSSPAASASSTRITSDNGADDGPPGAAPPAPAAALPGGPDGAGPFPPPPPCPVGGGFLAAASADDRALRASARRVANDSTSDGVPGPDSDVTGIRAAGAPLARIAAMGDGGGPAGPLVWVASEMSFATLGGAERPETGDVPDSTGGATGAGVEVEETAAEAEAAGCIAAASELADPESTTAKEAVLDSATGAGAGATAGAGSTAAGGGCTTAGAGAGSTATGVSSITGAGAGSTTGAGVGSAGAGV